MILCVIRQKFRQTFLMRFLHPTMPLTQADVHRIVLKVVKYGQDTNFVADQFDISRRRVQQLAALYRKTGNIPVLQQRGRKPYASYPSNIEKSIIHGAKKLHAGSTVVAKYLRKKRGVRIGNNVVCEIMKQNELSQEDPRKRVKKKPWVRYERKHPLSAVHIDWHENNRKEKVCAITDDCSRRILAIGEYNAISSDTSISLMMEVMEEYSYIRDIKQVISDHGAEFYANKRDKHGNADHKFEKFCKEHGIIQLLCGVGHPQTNGKLEKFFDIYDKHRWEFESLEEFTQWYNIIRPHMSLDFDELETPYQAFYNRLQDIFVGNFGIMMEKLDLEQTHEKMEVKS